MDTDLLPYFFYKNTIKEAHKLVSIFQLMHEIVCSHYVKQECAKIIQNFQQIVDKNDN
jgi:hypothetical protein